MPKTETAAPAAPPPEDNTQNDNADALLREFDAFFADHPDMQFVDALFFDMCGLARGKRLPRSDADKLVSSGLQMPRSLYFLDVTGENEDIFGMGFSDGDPDGTAFPVPGSFAPVPWSGRPRAQVLMTMRDEAGGPFWLEPRNVLAGVLKHFEALRLSPTVAVELEFCLIAPEPGPEGPEPLDPSGGVLQPKPGVYSMDTLDTHGSVIGAIAAAAEAQGIPATAATSEFTPGQYEINLRHRSSALRAADDGVLLRHLIRSVAREAGERATFMAKPFADHPGNGMHIHVSLMDHKGRNVFDDGGDKGSDALRYAIGGLKESFAEAFAFFAPNLNAMRRFQPNAFVPLVPSWGYNNRSVAFRIPEGEGRSRRIEHRVAGADANPYLVIAAILAGLLHGLANELDPGEPETGNRGGEGESAVPSSFEEALDRLTAGRILSRFIERRYIDAYAETKRRELAKFRSVMSPLEIDWYL